VAWSENKCDHRSHTATSLKWYLRLPFQCSHCFWENNSRFDCLALLLRPDFCGSSRDWHYYWEIAKFRKWNDKCTAVSRPWLSQTQPVWLPNVLWRREWNGEMFKKEPGIVEYESRDDCRIRTIRMPRFSTSSCWSLLSKFGHIDKIWGAFDRLPRFGISNLGTLSSSDPGKSIVVIGNDRTIII
jgi:hypothetical protein